MNESVERCLLFMPFLQTNESRTFFECKCRRTDEIRNALHVIKMVDGGNFLVCLLACKNNEHNCVRMLTYN